MIARACSLFVAALAASLTLATAYGQGQPAQNQQGQQAQGQPQQQPAPPQATAPRISFADLVQQVREMRQEEAQLSQEREAQFNSRLRQQEQLARETEQRRDAAEARSNALDRQWQDNEARIAELRMLLTQHEGNLGELFGVTRQVAGDAANVLQQSMLTALYTPPPNTEERAEFMRRLAGARALPSITELERLWYELMREMTDSGKVVKFNTGVLQLDDSVVEREVVMVGPFIAVSDGQYLGYLGSEKSLATLNGQLASNFRAIGQRLQNTPPDAGYTTAVVDPGRGSLLGLYVVRPGVIQRIQNGEVVGYVIVAVGILGVVLALYQAVYLIFTRFAVSAQLRNLSQPNSNNPLGRVLLAFRGDGKQRVESPELAELRISEAVLREVPKLERFQSFLRLAVAAGPLLGLIGTVVGMIITFKAITASGSSDPKLMAHGIGQAMIATVLGLGIAIPLLFINAGLAALSRGVTQTLDEQSQVLLAETVGGQKHTA